jgi:hypothetical protein
MTLRLTGKTPLATMALYGPTNKLATKLVLAIAA